MKYFSQASSIAKDEAFIQIKSAQIAFGITPESADDLLNPAELLLGSLSACILKNVERFSILMNFNYSNAEIFVEATRFEKPPKMEAIIYVLKIYSTDNTINLNLLRKNIENFGTIYNTIKASCNIKGDILIISE